MPIVKPQDMNFAEDNIIMIISGLPGVGKTTLAFSAPDPVLIDVDNGVKRVNPAHRKDAVMVKTYEELLSDMKTPEFQKYQTVIIDTTGAFIDMLKDWAMRNDPQATRKNGGFSQQGYGIVKSEFLRFSAELRKTHNVIYLFHTSKSKDKDGFVYDLMCEGAAREIVWQPADLGAYMQIIGDKRFLCFTPTQEYSAKSSYGVKGMIEVPELSDGEPNIFLEKLFDTVKANIAEENKAFAPLKAQYEAVMEQGRAIIGGVGGAEDITPAADKLAALPHSLTSEKELKSLLAARIKELGISWNRETKQYEQK